jgi:hypothetical protein
VVMTFTLTGLIAKGVRVYAPELTTSSGRNLVDKLIVYDQWGNPVENFHAEDLDSEASEEKDEDNEENTLPELNSGIKCKCNLPSPPEEELLSPLPSPSEDQLLSAVEKHPDCKSPVAMSPLAVGSTSRDWPDQEKDAFVSLDRDGVYQRAATR